jgi:hypothetical protein
MTATADAVASKAERSAACGPLKQIDAGLLNVGNVDGTTSRSSSGGPLPRNGTSTAPRSITAQLPQEAPEAFAKAVIDVDTH